MKIEQQAIEELQRQFKCIGIDYTENKDITAIAVAHGEQAEAVIRALKKQIPKKICVDEYGWNECPNHCTLSGLIKRDSSYCPYCGQALKWD